MDNPRFVDEETIPLVQYEDYDNDSTLNTSRIDKTLYRHLNVTGDIDLIDLNRYRLTVDPRKGATIFEFYNADRWVPLTKQTGKLFAPKTLRDRFGGVNPMKNFLGIDKTPPALERSFKTATKVKAVLPTDLEMESIPLEGLSPLVEDVHVKTREASQNIDLDMSAFLGVDRTLQKIQGELLNKTLKLTEINNRIQRDNKKLEEVGNDPIYTYEQRQLYMHRLEDLKRSSNTSCKDLANP